MADNIRNLFLDFLNNELENLEINNLEDNPGVKKKASQEFIDKIEGVVGIDDKVCNRLMAPYQGRQPCEGIGDNADMGIGFLG